MARKNQNETETVKTEIVNTESVQPIVQPTSTFQMVADGNAIAFNRIWHLRVLNYRLDLGSADQNALLRKALLEVGQWSASNGIVATRELPDPRFTHEKLVEMSLAAMKIHHQELKTAALNKSPESLEAWALKGFETRWLNPATNDYHKPDLFGCTGFRRGNKVLDEVNGLLLKANRPIIDKIYVTLKSFPTMAEFHREQRIENESAKEGSLDVRMEDRLRSAMAEWHDLMSGPSDIVKMGFAQGTAQKLYGILRLNEKYPDLNVVKNILETTNQDHTPINRFDKETIRPYYQANKKAGTEMKSKEDFIKLLESFRKPKQERPTGASKAQIEKIPEVYPTSDVHLAWHAFLTTGNNEPLSVLKAYVEPLNMLYAMAYEHVDPKLVCECLKTLADEKKVTIKPTGLLGKERKQS